MYVAPLKTQEMQVRTASNDNMKAPNEKIISTKKENETSKKKSPYIRAVFVRKGLIDWEFHNRKATPYD